MPSAWFPNLAVLVRMYFVSMYGQYYPTEGLPRGVKDARFFTATSDTNLRFGLHHCFGSSQNARSSLCNNFYGLADKQRLP